MESLFENNDAKLQEHHEQVAKELMPRKFGTYGMMWLTLLILVAGTGLYYYIQQLRNGLIVTGLRDYTIWGIYIANFVFFVAISLVGSLVSAILKLTNVKWRTPLTRISEMIAVASIMFAGLVIIIDMGRPDRFLNVIFHARIQSPITWDVIVITTYLFISLLLLYLPMVPDLAYMRDRLKNIPKWQQKMYAFMANNWKNTPEQRKILNKAITILSVLIIPVAFGIHTVTSWLFATTLRAGWDSTNFGPYFISGAFMVGAGAVIAGMYVFRNFYHYEKYITLDHFDKMGKLLVLLSMVYLYFNVNEYFIPAYKMKGSESAHLNELFTGVYAPLFWSVQIGGMVIPILVLLFNKGRKPLPMFVISVMVIVGAWFKRFLIVIPTLNHPFFPKDDAPAAWSHYTPTVAEWFITAGTLAGALLVVTLLVRFFPIIPVIETIEEENEQSTEDAHIQTSLNKQII
ncbi:MAG: NrfD/PsrC family molybdoenzyme membrane anchor subunit, partial [Saprospiraceae bacterium]